MDRSRTKQVCTIGPASIDRIGEMVAAGMDVARINFSHGTPDDHRTYVHAVRSAAHSARRSVAVLVDLPGPKIRLGPLAGDAVELVTGSKFVLRAQSISAPAAVPAPQPEPNPQVSDEPAAAEEPPASEPATDAADAADVSGHVSDVSDDAPAEGGAVKTGEDGADPAPAPESVSMPEALPAPQPEPAAEAESGDANEASVSIPGLAAQLQVGDRILLADGAAELKVTGISGTSVETEVVHGGTIRSRSGVNIPSSRLTGDGLTAEDRAAIPRALELRADLIAQSFVRTADDVRALRAMLPADGPRVIAKIETQAAVDNFDEIAALTDGIMVARGDLGVDLPFEDVPLVQKDLVRRASRAGRFSIVATQMLESMTGAPRPTRAEASDVANAVLDGADAVMLSAESAIGEFPLEALAAMARICAKTEVDGARLVEPAVASRGKSAKPEDVVSDSVIDAASLIASQHEQSGSCAIWCFTRSGRTAELLSLKRPRVPIVAFTLSPIVARRLAVRSGVIPMVLPANGMKGEPLIGRMESAWRAQRNRTDFDKVIVVTTSRQPSGINRIEVHRLAGPDGGARPN